MRNKNNSGFTLIELLVVIAIIGLLASVVLLALNGARAKSRDAKRIADVRQIASALELYFNDYNGYPASTTAVGGNGDIAAYGLTTTYMGQFPTAPTPFDSPCASAAQNAYVYSPKISSGIAASYTLSFCLGGTTGGYSAGPHTLTQGGIQ